MIIIYCKSEASLRKLTANPSGLGLDFVICQAPTEWWNTRLSKPNPFPIVLSVTRRPSTRTLCLRTFIHARQNNVVLDPWGAVVCICMGLGQRAHSLALLRSRPSVVFPPFPPFFRPRVSECHPMAAFTKALRELSRPMWPRVGAPAMLPLVPSLPSRLVLPTLHPP